MDATMSSTALPAMQTSIVDRLKAGAKRNQKLIMAAQYLVGASTFILPLRAKNYEVYTEASYALSQLIAFFNQVLLSHHTAPAATTAQLLRQTLWLLTRTVGHVEVFLEKLSLAFGGEQARSLLVLVVELSKAASRVILLLRRRHQDSPTMLLNWAREYPEHGGSEGEDEPCIDLAHYLAHYRAHGARWLDNQRSHTRKHHFVGGAGGLPPATPPTGPRLGEAEGDALSLLIRHRSPAPTTPHRNPTTHVIGDVGFVGRRSGLVLPSPAETGLDRSPVLPTATPARRRWDQRWDDDGESQWGSAESQWGSAESSNTVASPGGLSTGRSAGAAVSPWAAAGAAMLTPPAARLGQLLSPPTEGAAPRLGDGDAEGSTDADSASRPPSAPPSGRATPEDAGVGQGEPPKKGWVVWTLEGTRDERRPHMAGVSPLPAPVAEAEAGRADATALPTVGPGSSSSSSSCSSSSSSSSNSRSNSSSHSSSNSSSSNSSSSSSSSSHSNSNSNSRQQSAADATATATATAEATATATAGTAGTATA